MRYFVIEQYEKPITDYTITKIIEYSRVNANGIHDQCTDGAVMS